MVLRSDNAVLVSLLKSMKFKKTGVEIPSTRGNYSNVLFARE
jgi:hypothetical protein